MDKSTKQPPVANRPKAQARRGREQARANKRMGEQTRKILRTHYANKYRVR